MSMSERPINGSCRRCKFYYDEDIPDTVGCGECRYVPPSAMPISMRMSMYHDRAFPLVSEYDWCWRFERIFIKNRTSLHFLYD
jgi:hypothetical protein